MVTDFKNKKKRNVLKTALFHLAGLFVLVLSFCLVFANVNMYQKSRQFLSQVSNLQNQIQDIKNSNSDLKLGISSANDPAYIEKVAREELDLQKPGEQEVSFIMPKAESQKTDTSKQNFLQIWWQWIIGHL